MQVREEGAMLLTQETVNHTLECVWISSGKKLSCVWVQREQQSSAPAALLDHASAQQFASAPRQRVA
jgi:hypothetical protein